MEPRTLKLLNDLFSLRLTNEEMKSYAGELGSDCAFFIENKPVFGYEKGDKFKNINLSLKSCNILLVKPEANVNTKEAYNLIRDYELGIRKRESIYNIIKKPILEWKDILINDFEEEVFKKYPEIKDLKDRIYNSGAILCINDR